jgi:hypothetical protein
MLKNRLLIMASLSLVIIIGIFLFVPPIPQDVNYHNFADGRTMLQVPNFWNVLSNIPFFLVGGLGLYKLYSNRLVILNSMKFGYALLFFGVALVAFGSGYYHLEPNNETLVWDRLPMTIAFMSLFAILLSEFIEQRVGKRLLFPLLLVGMGSVFYWYWGEMNGAGDLRAYALVQFLPMLIIPVLLYAFKPHYSHVLGYWLLLLCYLLAKVFEYFDGAIYTLLGQAISGHSLKHIVAALGMYILLVSYEKRIVESN